LAIATVDLGVLLHALVANPAPHSAPLTPLQQGMLLSGRRTSYRGFNVLQHLIRCEESIDPARLGAAFAHAAACHAAMRLQFRFEGVDVPRQHVGNIESPAVAVLDWSADPHGAEAQFLLHDRQTGFVLDDGPLWRITCAHLGSSSVVCFTHHHLLLDGRSFAAVLQTAFAHYDGNPAPINDDGNTWLRFCEDIASADHRGAIAHGVADLAGKATATPLPKLLTGKQTSTSPQEVLHHLDAAMTQRLVDLAKASSSTVGSVVEAAWGLCLARHANESDVVFGSIRAGRTEAVRDAVGMFINTIPVRVVIDEQQTVSAWLAGLRQQELARRPFVHAPLGEVLLAAGASGSLLSSVFMFDTATLDDRLKALSPSFAHRHVNYREHPDSDLVMTAFGGERLLLRLLFDEKKFSTTGAQRLVMRFAHLLDQLRPTTLVRDIGVLDEAERRHWLVTVNDVDHDYVPTLLQAPFETTVDRLGPRADKAVALVTAHSTMSYGALEAAANRVAHALIAAGVLPGDRVGVLLPREPSLVVSLLAVLKAGACYVPMDTEHPLERQSFVVSDTECRLVLTHAALSSRLPSDCRTLDPNEHITGDAPSHRPSITTTPRDLCYLIFTSGSTGKPKGVMLSHGAVVNTIEWVNRTMKVTADDRLLFVTSPCFDLSVYDIFGVLGAGGQVRIACADELATPERLVDVLVNGGITIWDSAPAALARIMPLLTAPPTPTLRVVMMSGDWIPIGLPDSLRQVFGARLEVHSLGGATEAAIWSNHFRIDAVDPSSPSIPYGRPIANCHYHVLDELLRPLPPGVAGDLYIGGTCLADGYWHRPELSAERFVDDPFGRGGKLYKTGDLARYYLVSDDHLLHGQLEFLGRSDFQVKIRGYRVELGEVEQGLLQQPNVRAVVCAAIADASGQKSIAAYVVPVRGAQLDTVVIKRAITMALPDYMVPSFIIVLDELPLSSNGKVDRKALPPPGAVATVGQAPRTTMEKTVAAVFCDVLQRPQVSVDESFFDLGGHSLLATVLVARLERAVGRRVPVSLLFDARTVESLAVRLAQPEDTMMSPLLHLGGRSGRPIIFLPGVGGHVFTFMPIVASLAQHARCFGLRTLGTEASETAKHRIDELVDVYLDLIDRQGLRDPLFAGYSFGGYVAYELALRLQQRGQTPGLVIFDTLAPGYPKRLPLHQRLWLHLKNLLAEQDKLGYLRDRVGNIVRRWTGAPTAAPEFGLAPEAQQQLQAVVMASMMAQQSYRPSGRLRTSLSLVRASEVFSWPATKFDDPAHGWGAFVEGPIDITTVPGNHLHLFEGDNPALISQLLSSLLAKDATKG
jgi:amino acid adenylation domain-containing protein